MAFDGPNPKHHHDYLLLRRKNEKHLLLLLSPFNVCVKSSFVRNFVRGIEKRDHRQRAMWRMEKSFDILFFLPCWLRIRFSGQIIPSFRLRSQRRRVDGFSSRFAGVNGVAAARES